MNGPRQAQEGFKIRGSLLVVCLRRRRRPRRRVALANVDDSQCQQGFRAISRIRKA